MVARGVDAYRYIGCQQAWHRCVRAKRAGKTSKRPIADVLIRAFASRFDGVLTRNAADFQPVFPTLNIVTP